MLDSIFPYILQRRNPSNSEKIVRNNLIRQRYAEGDLMSDLSSEYGLSRQRISQIVHYDRQ
jgi:hypothetical protein